MEWTIWLCLLISKFLHNSCFELNKNKERFLDFWWSWHSKKRPKKKITLKPIDSFLRYRWSKNLPIWLDERKPSHIIPKVVVSKATFIWYLTLSKKTKMSIDSFQRHWLSKDLIAWLGKRHKSSHPTKSSSLRCYLPLMIISM